MNSKLLFISIFSVVLSPIQITKDEGLDDGLQWESEWKCKSESK